MSKMVKRLLSLLTIATMLLSMVGCGEQETKSSDEAMENSVANVKEETNAEATEETIEETTSSDEKKTIGLSI